VAAEVVRLADAYFQGLAVINALAVCDSAMQLPATLTTMRISAGEAEQEQTDSQNAQPPTLRDVLIRDLDALYRVDTAGMARLGGWEIRRAEGGVVYLVVAQEALAQAMAVLETLHAVIAQQLARRLALAGIALHAANADHECDVFEPFATALAAHHTFVEGVYTLTTTNVWGLATPSETAWEAMIAQWIVEMASTPLGPSVAALPLQLDDLQTVTTLPRRGSFGLARWQFPAQALREGLNRRLQRDMLAELLWAGDALDVAMLAIVRDRCAPPSVLPALPQTDFAAARSAWTRPNLHYIHDVRAEIDAAAAVMLTQATALVRTWDTMLDQAHTLAVQALDAELERWMDTPRSGCLTQLLTLLTTAQRALLADVDAAEAEARSHEDQHTVHHAALAALGTALTAALARFPAWSLRAWWRVIRNPWRWMRIVNSYREIVRLVEAYTAGYEALWLAMLRAGEARWQAQYARMLADDVAERVAVLHTAVAELAARCGALTEDIANTQTLDRLLADAALPAHLKEHFYTRNVAHIEGEVRAAFAAAGGLSMCLHLDFHADNVLVRIADYADERFAFLDAIRLDELLVRTYSGAELRARLAEFVEAAAPFWPWDAGAETGNGFVKRAWIGLPAADEAPLVDLLPERGIACYSTGIPGCITAVQIWWAQQ